MQHPHGTFCWLDIYLPDPQKGKGFYGSLFGWEWTDMPMGDSGMSYTMFNLGGKNVAAMGPQMPGHLFPEGVPPMWNPYIATDDLNATAEKATAMGATLLMGPADVGNGRVALVRDPEGAMFFLWQALDFGGAEVVRVPGSMAWTEHYTRDLSGMKDFYTKLFGWEWSSIPIPQGGDYHLANLGDVQVAGVLVMDENWGEMPSHWMVYFQVEDADAAASEVTSLGGKVCVPVTEISVGRFAVVNDDQQGTFTIFEPTA
jgi:hypothetical protein